MGAEKDKLEAALARIDNARQHARAILHQALNHEHGTTGGVNEHSEELSAKAELSRLHHAYERVKAKEESAPDSALLSANNQAANKSENPSIHPHHYNNVLNAERLNNAVAVMSNAKPSALSPVQVAKVNAPGSQGLILA